MTVFELLFSQRITKHQPSAQEFVFSGLECELTLLITPQADIGNGWNDLWDPEAEKEPDPVRGELSAIVVT